MRIFHVATEADWRQAQQRGSYTTSTYGAGLDEVGFIHAARADQVAGVVAAFYADVTEPLVTLEIETDLLDVPWREDPVGDDTFPHVYGPLPVRAVVATRPALRPPPAQAARAGELEPVVRTFFGLAGVLGTASVVLLGAAGIAHSRAHEHVDSFGTDVPATLTHSTEFLVWTIAAACTAATLAALVVALILMPPQGRR